MFNSRGPSNSVISLHPEDLVEKLILNRRGGYCYEGGLISTVLQEQMLTLILPGIVLLTAASVDLLHAADAVVTVRSCTGRTAVFQGHAHSASCLTSLPYASLLSDSILGYCCQCCGMYC